MFRPAPPPGFTREEVAGLLCLAFVLGATVPLVFVYIATHTEG
jgi:hypothetical protein